jgi:hypothetical protein
VTWLRDGLDAGSLLPFLQASSTNLLHLLTSLPWSIKVTLAYQLAALPLYYYYVILLPISTTVSFGRKEGVETSATRAATRLLEKMPHAQPAPRSEMAQRFARAKQAQNSH